MENVRDDDDDGGSGNFMFNGNAYCREIIERLR
jgi:hypothetical protein